MSKKDYDKKNYHIAVIGVVVTILIFIASTLLDSSRKSTTKNDVSEAENPDYTISSTVSDTISENLEPTKKIVVTASDDTVNMTIESKSSTKTYGPFNMTMESSRRFYFLAVFEPDDTYTVTITAYSEMGDTTTKEIIIDM